MRKLLLPFLLAVLPACDRVGGQRNGEPGSFGSQAAGSNARRWRGIYTRDGVRKTFRLCTTTISYVVTADTVLLGRLDANVDWHAPRPTTTIFAALIGDTSNVAIEGDSTLAGALRVTAIDTTRESLGNECAPPRPEQPPPADPQAIAAGVRRALGADSVYANPAAWKSAATWLDGDWRGDALVLLDGEHFCERRGCTLLVLRGTPAGYVSAGIVKEALAPVVIRPGASNGWRNISVRWNAGVYGDKYSMLRFGGRVYPPNASLQPQLARDADSGRTVIAASTPRPSR